MNKKPPLHYLLLLALIVITPKIILAAPNTIRFQGRLTDSGGTPIVGNDVQVKFAFYLSASGGAPVWETASPMTVATNDAGLFATDIGPVDAPLFANHDDIYLQMSVHDGTSFKPLLPRQRLSTVPYAIQSNRSEQATIAQTVADNSVMSQHIQAGAVHDEHIASVSFGKITGTVIPSTDTVTTDTIVQDAVTEDKIAPRAVTTFKISTGAVTDAQINDVSAEKITGKIGNSQIGASAVHDENINDVAWSKVTGAPNLYINQIVPVRTSAERTTTSSSFVTTNLSASITPKSAASQILILVTGTFGMKPSALHFKAFITIFRNSTNLGNSSSGLGEHHNESSSENDDGALAPTTLHFYDSPATTTQLTYSVRVRGDSGGMVTFGGFQSMTLIEIATKD